MTVSQRIKKWWKHAVIYQIYPSSFCDSNGDGIGDLRGILSKLDYLRDLGANAIWICPMYDSPQIDMGYDVRDYEDVYRPYGTVEDMEVLIKETHDRGMKIMLDLVINHTSDQHAWFKESRSSKDNPKRDWYIWQPAKHGPSGERLPPNNWRSCFGGRSAWEWDEHTEEYYLRLFAKEQPDVNWENETTRKALYATAMEFWLDRGVDGFRVDTVNLYSKPPGLPDAPITDPEAEYQAASPVCCNGPRIHEYLGEMNQILSRYEAITVGELPCTPDLARVLRYVSAEAKQLDMVFQFDIVDVGSGKGHRFETTPRNFTLPDLKAAVGRTQTLIRGTDAWTTVFTENHDQARSVSRFADDSPAHRARGAKMLALMQACLSGTQYVYQGQEIGTVNAPKDSYPLENYLDIDSVQCVEMMRKRYGDEKGVARAFDVLQYMARDHARLPMAWDGAGRFGGFSQQAEREDKEVQEPWMKPHPLASEINVASQLDDPESVLAFWKKALRFRQEHADLLVYGDYEGLRPDDPGLHLFLKEAHDGKEGKMLVVLNFTSEEKTWDVPDATEMGLPEGKEVKLVPAMSTETLKDAGETLAPFEGRAYLVSY